MGDIAFVHPKRTIPLSLTGDSCALRCSHCNGHFLGHMSDVFKCEKSRLSGVDSYLVSGGCDAEGAVPLKDHIDVLRSVYRDHRIVAHTGLIRPEDVELVSPYIDAASFNLLGDDRTIREVYGLSKTTEDFIHSYIHLSKRVKTFPHITIGLHAGHIRGEYKAVDVISDIGAEAVVFNVFIPTKGTAYAGAGLPKIEDVKQVMTYASKQLDDMKVYLGCMRPGGSFRANLDTWCVEAGVSRIVMPSQKAREHASQLGLDISYKEECCVL